MKRTLPLLLTALLTSSLLASDGFSPFVKNFTYKGNQIHPYCITKLLGESLNNPKPGRTINLDSCNNSRLKVSLTQSKTDPGWYSSTQKQDDLENVTQYKAVSNYYKNSQVFSLSTNIHQLNTTGAFSAILLVKKVGNKLHVIDTLAHGDKCDGGISGSYEGDRDGNLFYSVNLTPDRLIRITSRKSTLKHIKLSQFPGNCAAEAHYTYDYPTGKILLEDITLATDNPMVTNTSDSDLPRQERCFNGLFKKQLKVNRYLSAKQAQTFGRKFVAKCL